MIQYASNLNDNTVPKQDAPVPPKFATPNACKKRDVKTSEKYDSTLRRTIARESTRAANDFESPQPYTLNMPTNRTESTPAMSEINIPNFMEKKFIQSAK
jgi:hypothetical protein